MNIKQSFRIIFRNKIYSLLNIFGLAIGILSAILIFLWVEKNISYNSSIPNSKNIYIVSQNQYYGDEVNTFKVAPGPLYQTLQNDYPEIKRVVRSSWAMNYNFVPENSVKVFKESGKFVDPAIFEMIGMEFIKGDAKTAFEKRALPIVISETMAEKIFGKEDPVGRILKNDERQFEVTGVFKDLDKNSTFYVEYMIPFRILIENAIKNKEMYKLDNWRNNWMQCYVELINGADLDAVNKRLFNLIPEMSPGNRLELFLYPVNRLHLYGNFKDGMETNEGQIKTVRLFSFIGLIILFIACINFMNLSTARSQKRALEVGVRKTFGAKRKVLIRQFMIESAIVTLIALLLAIVLTYFSVPYFNDLISSDLYFNLFKPSILIGIISIGLLCTFMSGSYPAFYLSSFSPVFNLQNKAPQKNGSVSRIRQGLVIFQFASAYVLIFATCVVYLQLKHLQNRDFGINEKGLAIFEVPTDIARNFNSVRNALLNTGYVENTGLSDSYIIQFGNNGGGYNWSGKAEEVDPLVSMASFSKGLIETLGLTLVESTLNDEEIDGQNYALINESLAEIMGDEGHVDGYIERSGTPFKIKGIVKNFPFNDLYRSKPEPLIFTSDYIKNYPGYLFVRLNPGIDNKIAVNEITSKLQSFAPDNVFDAQYMEERFKTLFNKEKTQSNLSLLFAALAIFISCLGLFGLSAFSAEQRAKEIGIRKVLGATLRDVLVLLGKSYLFLLFIALLIGIPIAVYFTSAYLLNFEYSIQINIMLYAAIALFVMIIALITVFFQTARAAMINPVKSIKIE